MTTEATACPKCQSESIYYRHLSKVWACPTCGPIVPEETEVPGIPLAPCRVCGTQSVSRHPTGVFVCSQCGSNQVRRSKRSGYQW